MAYIGNKNDEPLAIQRVDPNTSFLLADSQSRDVTLDRCPTDFSMELNMSASGARRITHRNLQWTQPLWTHNLTDWEMIISFSSDGYTQKFVCYCFPWITFSTFAGRTKDSLDYQDPDFESYCAMMQAMLRTGLRKIETPAVLEPLPSPTFPDIHPDHFYVKYSRYRGMVIYYDQTLPLPPEGLFFRVERCSWMNKAHHVHGFGVLKQDSENSEAYYAMEDSLYANGVTSWLSAGISGGIYSRYAFVFSKEINRNRKITSFSNLKKSGLLNSTECTVVPLVFQRLSTLKNYITSEDPTVINLRPGDQLQQVRISMADEFGDIISCGKFSGFPFDLYTYYLLTNSLPLEYDLSTSVYATYPASTPIYDNDAITAALVDKHGFFKSNLFTDARLDGATPIVHYFEVTML
jgi:hypothetical protein